ncbi:MAG TPA: hypothetical protein VFU31_20830, partial [Candidatus Binatia bacterium]|nr:hypothetical protein [Candidatus Binatia bacterium]
QNPQDRPAGAQDRRQVKVIEPSVTANENAAPLIALQQESIEPGEGTGLWNAEWRLENVGADPFELLTVRLPHGQFKSDEYRFEPATELRSGEQIRFHVTVRCHEPEGLVTENAFLIFHVIRSGESWRIFVRIRVVAGLKGKPGTEVELITTQKAGFSGMTS